MTLRADTPTVVIAMFQKLAYFRREAGMYRRIAARGAVTVVGLAEATVPELPPGVRHVLVPAADDLEREWSVTVLAPEAGATLGELENSHDRDPHPGLVGPASLDRWLAGSASGTMPVGLVLLRVPGLVALRTRYGRRGELAVTKGLATGLDGLLGRGDRVVALGPEEFLLALPSAAEDGVRRQCRAAGRCADGIADVYPLVALPSLVAGTVTRARPLPVERLREHTTPARGVELVPA